MSSTTTPSAPAEPSETRFRAVFDRRPTARELAAYRAAHHALVLGFRGRLRRRVARSITRF
jgi:hypothetical protein